MPLRYTSDLAEHHAVRRSAGIFDLSHMGEVKVAGPEAGTALDHALVGALSAVAVGRARYTMIVSPSGGVIDDLIVYHVGDEEYLVVPNAGNRERVAAELVARCAGFDCTVEDISLRTCLIAVQGPRAQEVLVGVVESGAAMPDALRPLEGSEEEDCGPDVLCGPTLLERLRFYAAVRLRRRGTRCCWPVPATRVRTASSCSAARRTPWTCGRSSPVPRRPWSPPSSTASRCRR